MKNKILINAFLVPYLLCALFSIVSAQSAAIGFKSGVTIAKKTEAISENSKFYVRPYDKYETVNGKDILHRRLVDSKNGIFFGYDVEVSRTDDPNKFKIEIKPLSYKSGSNPEAEKAEFEKYTAAPLPKFPGETVVGNGDIIKLDLLENPEKKIKITDYLKISDDSNSFSKSFSELEPTRDFTTDDINLKLMGFEVFINGKAVAKMGGGGSGPNIFFTIPDRGRVIVSPFPREGYNLQKIGTIIDNKLSFTVNGDKYEIVSKSPILAEGGNWNAWILVDTDYKKSFVNPKYPNNILFGAGSMQNFFKNFEMDSPK